MKPEASDVDAASARSPGVAMGRGAGGALRGSLLEARVRSGVVRGPLFQRRVVPAVFGEPEYAEELVPAELCPARPHVIAWDAWRRMVAAAVREGVDPAPLQIHAGYRSVAFQAQIWEYRLAERRDARVREGLPPLAERDLERQQRKWTAKPGGSAHHTGFALDLALYHLGRTGSRRSPAYAWLVRNARAFGFYPYLPEAWHWEYNPPGVLAQLRALRAALREGRAPVELALAPDSIPEAAPRPRS